VELEKHPMSKEQIAERVVRTNMQRKQTMHAIHAALGKSPTMSKAVVRVVSNMKLLLLMTISAIPAVLGKFRWVTKPIVYHVRVV
jgi:hypothetical protein